MHLFKPDHILKALTKGPMTWHMLAAELGFIVVRHPSHWSWWQRFWKHGEAKQLTQDGDSLEQLLADMVAVGSIVKQSGKPERWALPQPKLPN